MNKQIRELAKQANTPFFIQSDGNLTPEMEKFAELIVRECANIVNREALLTDHISAEMNQYASTRLKNAFMKIKEYFGVEE